MTARGDLSPDKRGRYDFSPGASDDERAERFLLGLGEPTYVYVVVECNERAGDALAPAGLGPSHRGRPRPRSCAA